MECKSCGRIAANENANFCDYCGASYKEERVKPENTYNTEPTVKQVVTISSEEGEKSISFLNWCGTLLLPFIPLIGPIIYFVMMLIWSFSADAPKSKKNWARASLLVGIISIIIIVVFMTSTIMEILNSGLDMDSYMNQFY